MLNTISFYFDKINEKLDMMYLIKEIIQSPFCYLRVDMRYIMEKIYFKILTTPIKGQNQSNNIEVLFNCAYNNKHLINFTGKRYADEIWLYTFIKDDRKGKLNINIIIQLNIYYR